jgi:AcrR family transcriptional regulator
VADSEFQRARSQDAKRLREEAILDAARLLAERQRIRDITLTEIAEAVGMHKSAMLRYFETREEIFLRLTAEGWRGWSIDLRSRLDRLQSADSDAVAGAIAASLASRGSFCDLLSHTPLNLERNVSPEAVRQFKYVTHEELERIIASIQHLIPSLSEDNGVDLIGTTTALAGAFWQIATPGPEIAELYRSDPRLGHAIVELEPRLRRILKALIDGWQCR